MAILRSSGHVQALTLVPNWSVSKLQGPYLRTSLQSTSSHHYTALKYNSKQNQLLVGASTLTCQVLVAGGCNKDWMECHFSCNDIVHCVCKEILNNFQLTIVKPVVCISLIE